MGDIFVDVEKTRRQLILWEETLDWIRKNPEVYGRFIELALEKCARQEKFGIGQLTEVVRWDASVRFNKHDFKIRNAFRRYIAIRLYQDHPGIETWCTTKRGTDSVPDKLLGIQRGRTPVVDPMIEDLFNSPEFSQKAEPIPRGVIDMKAKDPDDDLDEDGRPDPDGEDIDFDELFGS